MNKRKILFINDSAWSGSGVFRSLQQVLEHISYDKFDATLFVYVNGPVEQTMLSALPSAVKVVISEDKTHYYRFPDIAFLYVLSRIFSLLRFQKGEEYLRRRTRQRIRRKRNQLLAKKYFKNTGFDVLVANTVPHCSEIGQFIRADKKYVVYHSSREQFFPSATKEALRRFNGMVAVSESVFALLARIYPDDANKLRLITNYVDAEKLREQAREYPLPEHTDIHVICTCGRFSKEKGFDLAAEAARILKEKGFDFIWYFVGDGGERQRIADMIEKWGLSDRIVLTGFLPNPHPYIGGCDIYVQPSREEAQPLAVMEARCLGRAIVCTETLGGETVLQNGEYGVLTSISAEGIASGVESLLASAERRAAFENLYTQEDYLREKHEYEEAWDRLLSE